MTDEYRYELTREVNSHGVGSLCWVMLNPSTADEVKDDPTIRKVKYFTEREGFARLVVVNLFAARATQPQALLDLDDPCGPLNRRVVEANIANATAVVFAWGDWLRANNARRYGTGLSMMNVERIAERAGHTPRCLGKTMYGSPKHPCYLPHSTKMEIY